MVPVHSGAAAAPAATSPSTANTANTRTNRWAIAFSPAGVGTGGESLVLRVRAVKVEPHPAVAGRDPRRPTQLPAARAPEVPLLIADQGEPDHPHERGEEDRVALARPAEDAGDEGQGREVAHEHDPERPAPEPATAPRRRVGAVLLRHRSSFRGMRRSARVVGA